MRPSTPLTQAARAQSTALLHIQQMPTPIAHVLGVQTAIVARAYGGTETSKATSPTTRIACPPAAAGPSEASQ